MTSVFHSTVNDIVPWQAHYSFPSMATKSHKQTVKLRPKNGGIFKENETILIDFPSDGYLNTLNSVLAFDVVFTGPPSVFLSAVIDTDITLNITSSDNATTVGFYENYVLRIKGTYGAGQQFTEIRTVKAHTSNTLLLDRPYYFVTGATYECIPPISLGAGGAHGLFKRGKVTYGSLVIEDSQRYDEVARFLFDTGVSENYLSTVGSILEGTSTAFLQENALNETNHSLMTEEQAAVLDFHDHRSKGKRMCLNTFLGSLSLKKLLPLKWMASQFSLHLELNRNVKALLCNRSKTNNDLAPVSYTIEKVEYIAELMDFDSTYDTSFFMGMKQTGIPLKFEAWHYHSFSISSTTHHLNIHERARSVKCAIAVLVDETESLHMDSNAFSINPLYVAGKWDKNGNRTGAQTSAQISEFQWRLGGKYYPAQPVLCDRGGAEAYVELLKLTGALGDYTFNTNMSAEAWGNPLTSRKFVMAAKFENDDVFPDTMSGINAEEMSDLTLSFTTSEAPVGKRCDIFVCYDSMMILRDGNIVDLVL